jgi:hypothetical protein
MVRDDAMLLMGASVVVPGLAAYCNKEVGPNQALLDTAIEWNRRNHAAMLLVLRAIEWSGGMSGEDRKQLDTLAYRVVKKMVDESGGAICSEIVEPIATGKADLDVRADIAPAYQRLQLKFPNDSDR